LLLGQYVCTLDHKASHTVANQNNWDLVLMSVNIFLRRKNGIYKVTYI
jgi:hypothetical protein